MKRRNFLWSTWATLAAVVVPLRMPNIARRWQYTTSTGEMPKSFGDGFIDSDSGLYIGGDFTARGAYLFTMARFDGRGRWEVLKK